MKRRFAFAAAAPLAMLLCSAASAQHPAPAVTPAGPPLKVGILHSMTGTMAISEQSLVDAMLMAIDEVNQRGGVLGRPLEPVVVDGRSDPQQFARGAERLIVDDQVASVFGCWTSASRKAVLPVVERHEHLLWYPLQYEGQESSRHVIYSGAAPNQQIIPALKWCQREFGPRVFLVGSDYVFPRTANQIIKLRLAAEGTAAVGEQYRPLGDDQFAEIAAEIKQSRPDFVLNTINGDSNRAFFAALRDAGIGPRTTPVMSFSIAEDELRSIGAELTAGHYCCWSYFQSINTPANRRFVRRFRRRFGEHRVTDDPIEAAYCQVHLFAKAARKAGSVEVGAIRAAARNLIFAAPGGLLRIDPRNQHCWKVARIGRIQADGQFKILWSSEDPLPPRPYLPEMFLAAEARHGGEMFAAVSGMIDLEARQPADADRKRLLGAMANVRGYLGTARAKLRSAVVSAQPGTRDDFQQAWGAFEDRWKTLAGSRAQLTEQQQQLFEQLEAAQREYAGNFGLLFETLFRPQPGGEVAP